MDVERTENLVEFVLKRNEQQSAIFRSAAARLSRARHRARHPTEIAAFKCMDGRLNLPVYTRTPPGVIQPFRNIGGKFDLGWPYLQEKVRRWVNYSIGRGRRCLILDTYHFSAGNKAYGCAGWGHDTEAAREAAFRLAEQAERVFGLSPRIIYPIVVGMETDEEGLVLHGKGGRQFAVANVTSPGEFEGLLRDLCPDMDEQMLSDLLPLLQGNWDHVREIRASRRLPIELDHREQIIGVGSGFDWLHMPNKALIVGPFSHAWPEAVATAGEIVYRNVSTGRTPPEQGALLLVSALSRDEKDSYGWHMAEEQARYLTEVSCEALRKRVPKLAQLMQVLTAVVLADTRKLYQISS